MSLDNESPRVRQLMIGRGWEKLGNEWCQCNGAAVQATENSYWYIEDLIWARSEARKQDVQTLNTSSGEEDA